MGQRRIKNGVITCSHGLLTSNTQQCRGQQSGSHWQWKEWGGGGGLVKGRERGGGTAYQCKVFTPRRHVELPAAFNAHGSGFNRGTLLLFFYPTQTPVDPSSWRQQ